MTQLEIITQPLRIMQVDDFYPGYLDTFYKTHHGLSLRDSVEQGKALFNDAFSAIHAVVPYLQGDDLIAEYFVSGAKFLQMAWSKEHGITFPANDSWELEMVRRRIEVFRPDVLYLANPITYDARFLSTLTHKPRLILGWRAADIPCSTDWNGYDVILSGLPRLLALAKALGAVDGVLFAPGMPIWIAETVADISQDTDVCFVGSISPSQHVNRRALLDIVARAAAKYGFSLALHLFCHPSLITPAMRPFLRQPVFGMEMHRALRRGRIVLDDRANHGFVLPDGTKKIDLGGSDTINMRLFEGTGGGSLLLTESLEGLSRFFEPEQEIITYRDPIELVQRILYFLQKPEARSAIASAGQRRCLTDHSMVNCSRRFLEIIRDHLS